MKVVFSRRVGLVWLGFILLVSNTSARKVQGGEEWDYIVVGAGASGCAVAAALSEGGSKVVVLEAGEPTAWKFGGRNQKEYFTKFGGDANVTVHDVPGESLLLAENPKFWWDSVPWASQGKGVGGSGMANMGISFFPSPEDFEHWPENWHYEDMEPFLKEAMERTSVTSKMSSDGELHLQAPGDVTRDFLEKQLGFRDVVLHEDPFDRVNVSALTEHYVKDGLRHDSCLAFLLPELDKRENLHLRTGATVKGITFSVRGQASGIELENGEIVKLKAEGKLVIAAGPLNSPKLLMLSGIGPFYEMARLEKNGLVLNPRQLWITNEQVGAGTHDHVAALLTIRVPEELGRGRRFIGTTDDEEAQKDFFNGRKNFLTQFGFPRVGFLAMSGHSTPDFEILPISMPFGIPVPDCATCFAMLVIMFVPRARDQLRIQTPDLNCDCTPFTCKTGDICFLNLYLSDEQDKKDSMWVLKTLIGAMEAEGHEVIGLDSTPEKILDFVENSPLAKLSPRHFAGSCTIGKCTDGDLKVKGTKNIYVVDSSTFPAPLRTHNVIPTIAVGRKAATHLQK